MQAKGILEQIAMQRKDSLQKIETHANLKKFLKENNLKSVFHVEIEELIKDTQAVISEDKEKPGWNGHLWLERKNQIEQLQIALEDSFVPGLGYVEDHLLAICVFIEKCANTAFLFSKYNSFVTRLKNLLKSLTPQQIHCNSQMNYLALKKIYELESYKVKLENANHKFVENNYKELSEKLTQVLTQSDIEQLKVNLLEAYADHIVEGKIQEVLEEQKEIVVKEHYPELQEQVNKQAKDLQDVRADYYKLSNQFLNSLNLLNKISTEYPDLYLKFAKDFEAFELQSKQSQNEKAEVSTAKLLAQSGMGIIKKSEKTEITNNTNVEDEKDTAFVDIKL